MSPREILVAIGLVALIAVLPDAGPGWDLGGLAGSADSGYTTLAGASRHLALVVATGAATLAVLLSEHRRRSGR
jgi:hypothetical protein